MIQSCDVPIANHKFTQWSAHCLLARLQGKSPIPNTNIQLLITNHTIFKEIIL
jgi:hypothetical protein